MRRIFEPFIPTINLPSIRLMKMLLYPDIRYDDGMKLLKRFDVALLTTIFDPFKATVMFDVVSPIDTLKICMRLGNTLTPYENK